MLASPSDSLSSSGHVRYTNGRRGGAQRKTAVVIQRDGRCGSVTYGYRGYQVALSLGLGVPRQKPILEAVEAHLHQPRRFQFPSSEHRRAAGYMWVALQPSDAPEVLYLLLESAEPSSTRLLLC